MFCKKGTPLHAELKAAWKLYNAGKNNTAGGNNTASEDATAGEDDTVGEGDLVGEDNAGEGDTSEGDAGEDNTGEGDVGEDDTGEGDAGEDDASEDNTCGDNVAGKDNPAGKDNAFNKYRHLFSTHHKPYLPFVAFQQVILKDKVLSASEEELVALDEFASKHQKKLEDHREHPWKVMKVNDSQTEADLERRYVEQ